jgi:hypothetical protein
MAVTEAELRYPCTDHPHTDPVTQAGNSVPWTLSREKTRKRPMTAPVPLLVRDFSGIGLAEKGNFHQIRGSSSSCVKLAGRRQVACLRQRSLAPRVARGMVTVGGRKTFIKKANATHRHLCDTRDPFFFLLLLLSHSPSSRPRSVVRARIAPAAAGHEQRYVAPVLYRTSTLERLLAESRFTWRWWGTYNSLCAPLQVGRCVAGEG